MNMKKHANTFIVTALLLGLGLAAGCGGGSGGGGMGGGQARSRVQGTVRDAQGNPVANATINGPGGIVVMTDANGNFMVDLPVGRNEIEAVAPGLLANGATVVVRQQNNDFIVVVLTPGASPPLVGNQPPQLGALTVNPSQLAAVGTVNFNVPISDNDSANVIAIAVIIAPDGTLTGVVLTRTGNTFNGSFRVPPNASRNNPAQTYSVVVAATDADNGSNTTRTSNTVTFTVNPPQSPPQPGLSSRVNRAKVWGR
jgi:hypothetical protein